MPHYISHPSNSFIKNFWAYRQELNGLRFIITITLLNYIFFILFYPFELKSWYGERYNFAMLFYCLLSALSLWISQYFYKKTPVQSQNQLLWNWLWMIIEISIIGFFQSLLKTFMFLNGQYEIKTLLECVKIAFIILPFSMFITYFILHYFFQPRPSLPKPTIQPLKPKVKRIIFKDDQQTTKLIVDENNLLYVQSQDNYIAVHYLLDKIVKKKLIRNTLKNISKDIGEGILIKVHRSYLVNISQLSSFQKEGKKHWIYLNSLPNDPIPVSSTYIKAVEEKLS